MTDWLDMLVALCRAGRNCVLITVAQAEGSTPRSAGTRMVVCENEIQGTIGGGHLEYRAIAMARELLLTGDGAYLRWFALGPELGQCCGGSATLLFQPVAQPDWVDNLLHLRDQNQACVLVTAVSANEASGTIVLTQDEVHGSVREPVGSEIIREARRILKEGRGELVLRTDAGPDGDVELLFQRFSPSTFHVALFGAGHVGRALAPILGTLSCRVTWIDGRPDQFPATVAANVTIRFDDAPEYAVRDMGPDTYYLVMTHSHALDLAICGEVLKRDFRYLGVIGSRTKRKKFELRLLHQGFEPDVVARITCPIGVPGIASKHPAEIAIATTAQILQVCSLQQNPCAPGFGRTGATSVEANPSIELPPLPGIVGQG